MQYKGDDLDLRVPHARTTRDTYPAPEYDMPNGRWPRTQGYHTGPAETLWVDETVLACCNYAFDVAVANGAGEVGLEHLVNALTRVEGAARILEARGVREGLLRRESASLIASEIPQAAAGDRVAPRRSADLEDVLRRAGEQASRRGAAASIDDVLSVLLHYGRDVPAVALLRRTTPEWQRLDWGRSRETAMPAGEPPRPSSALLHDAVPSRIGLIEDSLRSLHAELASERKALMDLIRDTQRDIVAQRGDAASLRGDLGQRLETLERTLQGRGDSARLTVQLSDRIQTLEKAVHGGLGEGARNWAALGQRLQTLEAAIGQQTGDGSASLALVERLGGIEQSLEGRLTQWTRGLGGLGDRVQSLERLLEASAGEGGRHWAQLSERLGTIETTLRARPAGSVPELGELTDRIGGLERAVRAGFGDSLRTSSALTDRIDAVAKAAAGVPAFDSDAVLILADRMQSIERMLEQQVTAAGPAMPESGLLNQRLASLEALVRDASGRVVGIEQSLQTLAAGGRDRETVELDEALVRLSENQHTLASAIADWRHESQSEFGIINSQIEKLAQPAAPILTGAETAGDFPSVFAPRDPSPRADTERYSDAAIKTEYVPQTEVRPAEDVAPATRGRGFWWWLFGTGNVAQANRDAEIQWERMHQRIKDSRDRRREQA